MNTTLTLRCTVSAPKREVRVSKGEYAASVFPHISVRTARRKLLQAILLDTALHRALVRAGWTTSSHYFTRPQLRILRKYGL